MTYVYFLEKATNRTFFPVSSNPSSREPWNPSAMLPDNWTYSKYGIVHQIWENSGRFQRSEKTKRLRFFFRPQSKIEESLTLRNINPQRNGGL